MHEVKRTRRSAFSSSDSVSSTRHQPPSVSQPTGHIPVLLHEVIQSLSIRSHDVVLDATLGGAGHARAMAEKLSAEGVIIGIDADGNAVTRARARLTDVAPRMVLMQRNFRDIATALAEANIEYLDKALFDLGWSSYQLSDGRGFSFQSDEPLQMTYNDSPDESAITAHTIVNSWSEETLETILRGWGEEKFAGRIARNIVEARAKKPITTSHELADIVRQAVPRFYAQGKLHPATRTFQALRIATNDELGALVKGLTVVWQKLAPGGRIAVISFHSIEDRAVKNWMKETVIAGGRLVHKKPIVPAREEILANPRARSAKLRCIEKVNYETENK